MSVFMTLCVPHAYTVHSLTHRVPDLVWVIWHQRRSVAYNSRIAIWGPWWPRWGGTWRASTSPSPRPPFLSLFSHQEPLQPPPSPPLPHRWLSDHQLGPPTALPRPDQQVWTVVSFAPHTWLLYCLLLHTCMIMFTPAYTQSHLLSTLLFLSTASSLRSQHLPLTFCLILAYW